MGNFGKVVSAVESQSSKVGKFDALLVVGGVLQPLDSPAGGGDIAAFISGEKKMSLPAYFVDSHPALLQASPRGRHLCENLRFLGGYGLVEISGLRVAFLSGRYEADTYDSPDADFVGSCFTARAIAGLRKLAAEDGRRGIDILLTCAWPAGIDARIMDEAFRPSDPSGHEALWVKCAAPPISELVVALSPRYHLFGGGDLFYQRPPFQAPKRNHLCRCIGLGKVGSSGKNRKWLHALALSPMSEMKREELEKSAGNSTPCPFMPGKKRPPVGDDAGPPKRPTLAREEVETALEAVLKGNADGYKALADRLAKAAVIDGSATTPAAEAAPAAKALAPVAPVAPAPKEKAKEKVYAWENRVEEVARSASGHKLLVQPKASEAELKGDAEANREAEEETPLTEEQLKMKAEAEVWLAKPPKLGVVRYTFKEKGPLGLRLSKDLPPWILEVRENSLAGRKEPKVPVAGVILAINGYDASLEGSEACNFIKHRPLVLDVLWPSDGTIPMVTAA